MAVSTKLSGNLTNYRDRSKSYGYFGPIRETKTDKEMSLCWNPLNFEGFTVIWILIKMWLVNVLGLNVVSLFHKSCLPVSVLVWCLSTLLLSKVHQLNEFFTGSFLCCS